MTKLVQRGQGAAASLLVPSLVLLALSLLLLAAALFPAAGRAEGAPEPAPLELSPQPLDFGKVTVGGESTTVTVEVHNVSASALSIEKVALEGDDSGEFKLGASNCGWLEPGSYCQAAVVFAPGGLGPRTATLAVQPKEAAAQTLALEGAGVEAQLAFTPGSYDFGISRANRGEGRGSLQLTNQGEALVQLAFSNALGIGGPNSGNFWVNGGDCWNGRQLQPGESCNVELAFNPWDMVAYEAELRASVLGGATFSAPLTGFGGRARVEAAGDPIDLGAVTVGAVGETRTVVLTNNGNLPGAFFIGIVAGGDAGSFQLVDESCSGVPVQPGDSCVVHLRFAPQGAGQRQARLALFGDDDGGTMMTLRGEGVAPTLSLSAAGIDFGSLAVGARSGARELIVRNDGAAPVGLGGARLLGADVDQFALAGDECADAVLAPGESCAVRVRFAPDSGGAKAARLRISGDAGPLYLDLAGSGEGAAGSAGAAATTAGVAASPGQPGARPSRHRARNRRFARGTTLIAPRDPRPRRPARASKAKRQPHKRSGAAGEPPPPALSFGS